MTCQISDWSRGIHIDTAGANHGFPCHFCDASFILDEEITCCRRREWPMVKLRSNKHVAFDPKLSGSNWETKLREFNDRKGTMVKNVEASNERNHHLSALLSPSSAGGSRSKQQRQTHSRSKQQKQTHVEGPFEPRRKRKRHPSDSGPLLLSSGHSKAPPQAPPRTLRLTRSSAPRVDHSFIGDDGERYYRCSHFGINRKVTYQSENFFLCSHCDWLDDAVTAEPNKTFDMTSKTFQCSAKHTSVIFPTQRVDRPNWLCYGYTKSSDRGGGDCGDFSGSDNDHDNDDNEDCGDHSQQHEGLSYYHTQQGPYQPYG